MRKDAKRSTESKATTLTLRVKRKNRTTGAALHRPAVFTTTHQRILNMYYYLYVEGSEPSMIKAFPSFAEASKAADEMSEALGVYVYVCQVGYPFSSE